MKDLRKYLEYRKMIARRLVSELSGGEEPDLGYIYDNYAVYLLGGDFETFLSYIATEK